MKWLRVADKFADRTYTELARNELGRPAGWIIQWSIILNNGGAYSLVSEQQWLESVIVSIRGLMSGT